MSEATQSTGASPHIGEMAERIGAHDWAATPLGEREHWPGELRYAVELMLASPQIASVAVGARRLLLYNDAAAALYGDKHPAALGRPLAETWPEAWAQAAHHYDRAFAGESIHVPAQPLDVERPGAGQVFDAYLTPVRDATGTVIAAQMTGFEVGAKLRMEAALRESEERQAFLLKLSDALRTQMDPSEIKNIAAAMLGKHLKASRTYYVEVETDGKHILVSENYVADVPSVAGRYDLDDYAPLLKEHYRAGLTIRIADTDNDERVPAPLRAAWAALGIQAMVGVPLVKDGRFTAALGADQSAPRRWSDAEVALVEDVAERTWAAVERARAEAALRESEERLRQFGEASQDILWIRDATTLQWQYLTPAFETIYGLSRCEALAGDDYRNWQDLIVAEDRADAVAWIERVLGGERATFEYRIRRPGDGAVRWLRNTDFPIVDEGGAVVLIGGVGHDMTDLKAVEAENAASEARLRTLIEGIPQLVWRSCAAGRWTWASPQWIAFTGQEQLASHGLGWLDAVHPDDREQTMRTWEEAAPHGMLDAEFRVRRAADGAWLWHHTRSAPLRDASGRIAEWLGTTTDIHALRELQERQGVLVAELQHRTRNLITVVRSLADRTLGGAASLDDFQGRFGRRLAALSRVQGLLSHLSAGARVDFDELLRSELTAMGVIDGTAERVTLEGPANVPLRSATVQTIALALHELATNAVKYGALSADAPDARLTVRWQVEPAADGDRPLLHVLWQESGVTMPEAGTRARGSGYGRELIERALPYQLGAKTSYEVGNDGVRCTITMPISLEGSGHRERRG